MTLEPKFFLCQSDEELNLFSKGQVFKASFILLFLQFQTSAFKYIYTSVVHEILSVNQGIRLAFNKFNHTL